MRATEAGQPAATRTHEEFIGLVCSDQDLLRAEFDAIIEAGWGMPPIEPERSSGSPARRRLRTAATVTRNAPAGPEQRERPRSPP